MYRISYRFLVPGWSAKLLVSAHDRIMGTHRLCVRASGRPPGRGDAPQGAPASPRGGQGYRKVAFFRTRATIRTNPALVGYVRNSENPRSERCSRRVEPVSRGRGARFSVEWIVTDSVTSHVCRVQSRYCTAISCTNPAQTQEMDAWGLCNDDRRLPRSEGVSPDRLSRTCATAPHNTLSRALLLNASYVAADHRQTAPAQGVGAGNSAVVVDLPRCGPMLSPRVPNLVPIPGPWMQRETPGQRPRPNYGHPHPVTLMARGVLSPAAVGCLGPLTRTCPRGWT